jgi:hypothetical protein
MLNGSRGTRYVSPPEEVPPPIESRRARVTSGGGFCPKNEVPSLAMGASSSADVNTSESVMAAAVGLGWGFTEGRGALM